MRGRWRVALAAVVAGMGVWLGVVGVAWGNQPIAMCAVPPNSSQPQQCGTADVSSTGWYWSSVFVSWKWTSGSQTAGCASQLYSQDTDQSDLANLPIGDWPQYAYCNVGGAIGSYPIQVEISNPTAQAVPTRPPDSNGWYNHPVAVGFRGAKSFSGWGPNACVSPTTYAGPDTQASTVAESCTDNADKVANASVALHYDATPPTITAAIPSRRPDHNGWYNHPVSIAFTGTDATSGISSCSDPRYAGPNSAAASLTGSCSDRAGNVATLGVPLHYDANPPPPDVRANPGDGIVALRWRTGADVAPITSLKLVRAPGLRGAKSSVLYRGHSGSYDDRQVRDGVRYRYTVTVRDQAGNVDAQTLRVTPGPRLLSPASGSQVSRPPLLRWTPVRRASYYNVQLYHGGKVLSEWPQGTSLQLTEKWSFGGRRYRLRPGRYRWYVWPGFGHRSAARYGPVIGSGTFVVRST